MTLDIVFSWLDEFLDNNRLHDLSRHLHQLEQILINVFGMISRVLVRYVLEKLHGGRLFRIQFRKIILLVGEISLKCIM